MKRDLTVINRGFQVVSSPFLVSNDKKIKELFFLLASFSRAAAKKKCEERMTVVLFQVSFSFSLDSMCLSKRKKKEK